MSNKKNTSNEKILSNLKRERNLLLLEIEKKELEIEKKDLEIEKKSQKLDQLLTKLMALSTPIKRI